ncbi:MAG: hypothetical protein Q7T53_11275 [Deltaproteobacteria bacterium]|nr:hypothetical protein [Deltaproteobacteria bacterium]
MLDNFKPLVYITSGNDGETVFFDDEDKAFYLKTLGGYSKKWGLDIWAYCLMANHIHIVN